MRLPKFLRRWLCTHLDSYFGQVVLENGRYVLVKCQRCGRIARSETLVKGSKHAS